MANVINNETRHLAYHNCSDDVLAILTNKDLYDSLMAIGQKHLPENNDSKHALITAASDLLLGLYTHDEFVATLKIVLSVDHVVALKILAEVDDIILKTKKIVSYADNNITPNLDVLSNVTQTDTATPSISAAPPTEGVEAVRTLDSDMKKAQQDIPATSKDLQSPTIVTPTKSPPPLESLKEEPVIQATPQADVLEKRPTLTTMPHHLSPAGDNPPPESSETPPRNV